MAGTVWTTDAVIPGERVEWWRERATETFGADYRIEPDSHAPFGMQLALARVDSLSLLTVKGCAHDVERKSDSGSDNIVVHLQLEGHCTVRAEGRETLVAPGCMTAHRVKEAHGLTFHSTYRQVCAILPESALTMESRMWPQLAGLAIPTASGMAAVLADHIRSLADHAQTLTGATGSELASFSAGMVSTTFRTLICGENPSSAGCKTYHLGCIKRFAREHLCDPGLDVDRIAGGVGLSPRYIHRLFEDEPLPLMRWVMKERLERAHAQLRNADSRLSVSTVAYALGFSDHAHFSRSFRKHFGHSPRELLSA